MWLGRRGPTEFCCSLSRVVVSPGPFSGPAEGADCCDLQERVGWGLKVHTAVLVQDGGVWEKGVWLLGGGVACGRVWLGLRLEDAVWDRAPRALDGGRFAGGVASGSGTRVPGGVTGSRDTEVSRRV